MTPEEFMRKLIENKDRVMLINERGKKSTYGEFLEAIHYDFYGIPDITVYTSGTTGKPKKVVHSVEYLLKKFSPDKKPYTTILYLLPEHIGGIDVMLSCFVAGGCVVVPESRDLDSIFSLIEKYRAEVITVTPSFVKMLLLTNFHKNYDLSSLRVIALGTEPISDYIIDKLREEFPNTYIKHTYGLTEIGTLKTVNSKDDPRYFKILYPEHKIENGILYIKNKNNRWFNTKDEVEMAEDGYIRVINRISDIISVGGNKVYPQEIETIIMQYSGIYDVLVYGEPNDTLGEIVVANVVKQDTVAGLDEEVFGNSIINYCKSRLKDSYKVPMKVNFVDKIEYTDTGKKRRI